MKNYEKMTDAELQTLKSKRWEKFMNYQNKSEVYDRLMREVNDEQVKRLIIQLQKAHRKKN